MQYVHLREFLPSIRKLKKKGGPFQRAAKEIEAALGRLQAGEDPLEGMQRTHHGESRIRHCIKYDLSGASRLVTVQHEGFCVFVYCGSHDEVDRWLDNHRGWQPTVGANRVLASTFSTIDDSETGRVGGASGLTEGPLFQRMPESVYERLVEGLLRRTVRALEEVDGAGTDDALWTILGEIADPDRRKAIYDTFSLLRQDRRKEALERARLYFGESTALEEIPAEALPDVIDSDVLRRLGPGSPVYGEALRRFINSTRYRDWMLFMHPDQEAIALEDFNGPAKLVGVSGSGKTCVVIQRAVRLARLYPTERILILTINRALARLISELLGSCITEEERGRIDVRPFFAMCQRLVMEFEPEAHRHYADVTWKINEHVDEIWQEYYRCEVNNHDARAFQPVHDSLLTRGWSPERYLREEVDWLRSALTLADRTSYLEMTRIGRTVPLTRQFRESILEGTRGWEEKMRAVGVIDGLGIAEAVVRYGDRVKPHYRCVLVDEAQDFGNIELAIVRSLVAPAPNDIFLCGDAAQAVSTKHQQLKAVGIDVPGVRSKRLSLNYRNSRDILQAAHRVLFENLTEEMIDREDFEILHPEYSAFSAATPLILEGESLDSEIAHGLAFVRERLEDRTDGKGCIAICGYSLFELSKFGRECGIPVLDGGMDIDTGTIFLSDLEQTKGFEFDVMCILNCSAGVLPSGSAPEDERFRDLARLYVAMTRAKTDLVLSWSRGLSAFLHGHTDHFIYSSWAEYAAAEAPELIGIPHSLESHRKYGVHTKPWQEWTGEEFLFSPAALGLSSELIAKIRDVIDGVGLKKRNQTLKWSTMGRASADFRKDPRARAIWGPEMAKQFEQVLVKLSGSGGVLSGSATRSL